MKEEHAKRIGELAAEMEEQAFVKLGESAKRALEENTLLLRQVAAVGGRLTTVEGQLANARYQNQGLKTLLNKMEAKYNEAVKQCNAEKNVRLLTFHIRTMFNVGVERRHSRDGRTLQTWMRC